MSKGLKALKELYETMPFVFEESRTKMRCLETIENELKDKDELAQALSITTCENGELLKYKKALEFLKDICNLKVCKNKLGQCFLEGTNILFPISKEEYNLLKEVML